jgi:hypothetical protein
MQYDPSTVADSYLQQFRMSSKHTCRNIVDPRAYDLVQSFTLPTLQLARVHKVAFTTSKHIQDDARAH